MTEIKPENDISETAKGNILFSAEPANELENLYKSKTAEYLFLFCNYEPIGWTNSFGFNYASALTNRYRLLRDTGDIIKDALSTYVINYPEGTKRFWNQYFKDTEDCRSVLSHNNSQLNGDVHKKRLQNVSRWFDHKTYGETDFKQLLGAMLTVAERFRTIAEKAIGNIPEEDRATVTQKTVRKIFDFYCKATNMDITTGQIIDLLPERVQKNKINAAKIFMYHLRRRDPSVCDSDDPFEWQKKYMEVYFRSDMQKLLDDYIKEDNPTLLPHGLIQTLAKTLIYPFRVGMKEKIYLRKEEYTELSDDMGVFKKTTALISNITVKNVIVIVNKTDPEYIDSLVNTSDGVTCRAVEVTDKAGSKLEMSEVNIDDIIKDDKGYIFEVV